MQKEVIAVFDIGKSNKKILLFDTDYHVVLEEDKRFDEITDDDDYACDNIEVIEKWMTDTLSSILSTGKYHLAAVNFATYGATLMYLDEAKKRLTPVYNYLKPMPVDVLNGFYDRYGGVGEFSRITASPALEMLNSGLQILWLKKKKPEVFKKVKHIVHFPQYLSLLFTGEVTSEYTSIGCHTAMWNFDKQTYHQWLKDEQITLPAPSPNTLLKEVTIAGKEVPVGIGIHDSSSSIVPYLMSSTEKFILISTGTWCVFMNPYNAEPLTQHQLVNDTLCYLSSEQKQVKSSRLFLGFIHEENANRLAEHFKVSKKAYQSVKTDKLLLKKLDEKNKGSRVFFKDGVPENYVDVTVDLSIFANFDEAYHQLMIDLVDLSCKAIELIETKEKDTKALYISGGFTNNDLYVRLIADRFPDKKVYTSDISNATALGAALVIGREAFKKELPQIDLGLNEITY
ncbi:MAG: FGGY family carbohydrate kinase [Bacteroidota bacterium]|nr:FGGY family carbohydrate kinase [Bacteroidota bacterium]